MIIDRKQFCLYIEELNIDNGDGIIQNVIKACDDHNIDPSLVEPLINRSIREKMEEEYVKLNYIKRDSGRILCD